MSRVVGGRLPASYVNYLLVNGGIVMPSFGVPEDSAAAELLGRLYPHRRLVQVPYLLSFIFFLPFFLSEDSAAAKLLVCLYPHRRLVQVPFILSFFLGQRGGEAPSPSIPSQAASTGALFFPQDTLAVSILTDWCTAFVYYNIDDNLCIDCTLYIYR